MLNTGQVLGKNTIVKELGSGNFGHVFSSRNEDNLNLVALKVCKLPIKDEEEKLRFIQENKILHNLKKHPKIIFPLSEMCEDSPYIYYLMELADFNLNEYLNKNYISSVKEKIQLFSKICEGLEHAHTKNVVHRDFWWNNVLIKKENDDIEIKINDFGRAKDFTLNDISSKNNPCWGCDFVLPPEMYFSIWDEKSPQIGNYILGDMYALGIILFYILIGYPSLYYVEVRGSIENFKRKYGLDISSLNIKDRVSQYNKWLQEQPNQSFVGLNIFLDDIQLTNDINKIIQKLCNIFYDKRYKNISELKTDLIKLNI